MTTAKFKKEDKSIGSLLKALRAARGVERFAIYFDLMESDDDAEAARARADEVLALLDDPMSGAMRLSQNERDRYRAAALRIRAAHLMEVGDPETVLALLNEALELDKKHYEADGRMKTLEALGTAMIRLAKFDDAVAYFSDWRKLARETDSPIREGAAERCIADTLDRKGEHDQAMEMIRKAIARLATTSDLAELGRAKMSLGDMLSRRGDYSEALDTKSEALAHFCAAGDAKGEARMYTRIGLQKELAGEYDTALEFHLKAIRLHQKSGYEVGESEACGSLAVLYGKMGKYAEAIDLITQNLTFARAKGYRFPECNNLINLGLAYSLTGDLARAFASLEEALTIAREIGARQAEFHILTCIASRHGMAGNFQRSLDYNLQALPLMKETGHQLQIATCLYNIGLAHSNLGELPTAITRFQQALVEAEKSGEKQRINDIHYNLAASFEQIGENGKALQHFKLYSSGKDEIFNHESDERIQRMQTLHQVEQSEREREIYRLKSEKLQAELEGQKKELTAKAMYLSQKNEALIRIKKELIRLTKSGAGHDKSSLKKIVGDIDDSMEDAQNWEAFEAQFHSVHPEFVKTLSAQYPKLSPTELKVCALIMLNLSSKESARILNVSARSLGEYRYRIRKKLGLGSKDNLSSFLAKL